MCNIADVSDMKSRERRNEIDARVIEDPKEAGKIVHGDLVQDKGISLRGPKTVIAVHSAICELFPEHG